MKKTHAGHVAALFALGTFLLPLVWFRPLQIVGDSMAPTFRDGEWVWTAPLFGNPAVGDCVIFESPTEALAEAQGGSDGRK